MDGPIDLETERNKRQPRKPFVILPEEVEPNMFLVELFEPDGTTVSDRVGLHFEIDGVPAVALTLRQCGALAHALIDAVESRKDSHGPP